eukprot:scaffold283938_cov32-Prasinocladus_malaysianus.AAC.1
MHTRPTLPANSARRHPPISFLRAVPVRSATHTRTMIPPKRQRQCVEQFQPELKRQKADPTKRRNAKPWKFERPKSTISDQKPSGKPAKNVPESTE